MNSIERASPRLASEKRLLVHRGDQHADSVLAQLLRHLA